MSTVAQRSMIAWIIRPSFFHLFADCVLFSVTPVQMLPTPFMSQP